MRERSRQSSAAVAEICQRLSKVGETRGCLEGLNSSLSLQRSSADSEVAALRSELKLAKSVHRSMENRLKGLSQRRKDAETLAIREDRSLTQIHTFLSKELPIKLKLLNQKKEEEGQCWELAQSKLRSETYRHQLKKEEKQSVMKWIDKTIEMAEDEVRDVNKAWMDDWATVIVSNHRMGECRLKTNHRLIDMKKIQSEEEENVRDTEASLANHENETCRALEGQKTKILEAWEGTGLMDHYHMAFLGESLFDGDADGVYGQTFIRDTTSHDQKIFIDLNMKLGKMNGKNKIHMERHTSEWTETKELRRKIGVSSWDLVFDKTNHSFTEACKGINVLPTSLFYALNMSYFPDEEMNETKIVVYDVDLPLFQDSTVPLPLPSL